MWPYLQTLDTAVTEQFYGYVIAIYPLGQIISSPLIGYWSNRIQCVKIPIALCLTVSMFGDILYLSASHLDISSYRKYMILMSRGVIGLGASVVTLLRSYAVVASKPEDRSRTIALVSGSFALGMTTGPAIQLLFTPLNYPGFELFGDVRFNMYTAPSFVAFIVNGSGIIALFSLFEEKYAGITRKVQVNENGELEKVKLPDYDKMALFICCLGRFTQLFTYTNIETLGSPMAMTMFALNKKEAVTTVATAHAFLSLFAFVIYAGFAAKKLDKYVDYRKMCIGGLMLLGLFHIITYSYPFLPGHLKTYDSSDFYNNTEPVGCNKDRFSWCDTVNPINMWVLYATYSVCVGIAFPIVNLSVNTLFTQIIGPRRQATLTGIQQSFGNVARVTGPLIISNIYEAYGPTISWDIEIVVIAITILINLLYYKRLVPLKV
ncbi:unnamed protein product [Bursaphelenchus okinawaensis]|uniref:Major facilitator superfamily (MFS) profile domain-containing protein n=1 Tax=Bursaphelenchus okinawaensis TaxID=465554 RepID=A0A811LNP2_9BILA|nr:unnamed protein product [Bursaphelenchus okinawaensis]CAG9127191.1 unnamed protein product [Bursaphelenchus okinawaensis]